jgi:sugar lactone lactonase YvrE
MRDVAELVLDARAMLGEGAFWDAERRRLLWVDILGCKLRIFDPATKENRTIDLDQHVGAVVPRRAGGVALALHHGFALMDLESGQLTMIHDPEADRPRNRFNDGKCDPAGRFWAGTISLDDEPGVAALYRMDADRCVHCVLEGVSISNGLAWSLDRRRMYYIDTPTREVATFDYDDATGAIAGRRVAIRVPESMGAPDGMTIDSEGMLWVALWGGGQVGRWDPATGRLLDTIAVPARLVTSCALGGPRLDELYITTARVGLSADELARQPLSGGLFRAPVPVPGLPLPGYAG